MTRFLLWFAIMFSPAQMHAADFERFSGTWTLSEKATIELWRREATSEEEKARVEKLIVLKQMTRRELGLPFHADVRVSRKMIVGFGAEIPPRFDLLQAEFKGGVLRARVLWHEDQGDVGDASEESIKVSKMGNRLRLDVNEGVPISYVFDPK